VHDEYGRVDPTKAAEPSKPRGSSGAKRPSRPSDENIHVKKARLDEDQEGDSGLLEENDLDSLIDPALLEPSSIVVDDPMQLDLPNDGSESYIEPDATGAANDVNDNIQSSSHIKEVELDTGMVVVSKSVKEEPDLAEVTAKPFSVQQGRSASSPLLKKENATAWQNNQEAGTKRTSMSPAQRHSSRQPKQVERYVPENHRSPTKLQSRPARSERRASSAASGQTMVNSVESRRSSSNTSGTTHRIAAATKEASQEASGRRVSRGSTVESEADADEKLARELQAEEHGLRRRASMRL
jgi:F-box and leucine-rich repeat protein 10/11